MTTLLFDAGSTKVTLALIDRTRNEVKYEHLSRGYNPAIAVAGDLVSLLSESPCLCSGNVAVDEIYYYGAGCASPELCGIVSCELNSFFGKSVVDVEVCSDMLAAAKALCGDDPGIVCILGTGSNSCLYDGHRIISNVSPLGYILGDEGSGAVLGRRFIGLLMKGRFPESLRRDFDNTYGLTIPEIINRVYRGERPNAFLASFAPFIAAHLDSIEVERFVVDEFRRFINYNLTSYNGFGNLPVHFAGSIAVHFHRQLEEALEIEGCTMGNVVREPLEALVKYHLNHRGKNHQP